MAYVVRCKGNEDGTYILSYGKGKGKLSLLIAKAGSKFTTVVDGNVWTMKLRELKERWSVVAAAAYGTSQEKQSTPDSAPVALPSAAADDEDADELNDLDRALFEVLATKTGRLTEWQRAQCRTVLRRLTGTPVVPVPVKTPSLPPPPKHKPKGNHEHVEESASPVDSGVPAEIRAGCPDAVEPDSGDDAPGLGSETIDSSPDQGDQDAISDASDAEGSGEAEAADDSED